MMRELLPEEIALADQIRDKGAELLALQDQLVRRLEVDFKGKLDAARGAVFTSGGQITPECAEFNRFVRNEPLKWAEIGRTHIQQGLAATLRALTQPDA